MGKIYFQDKQECKTHGRTDKQRKKQTKAWWDIVTVNLFQFSIRYLAAMGKERKEPGGRNWHLSICTYAKGETTMKVADYILNKFLKSDENYFIMITLLWKMAWCTEVKKSIRRKNMQYWIWFSDNASVNMNITPRGFELVICSLKARFFYNWATCMMIFNRIDWFKQVYKI